LPARHLPVPPSDMVEGPPTTDRSDPPAWSDRRGRRLFRAPLPAALFPPERRAGPTASSAAEKEYGP
jgi:hypothetical protein